MNGECGFENRKVEDFVVLCDNEGKSVCCKYLCRKGMFCKVDHTMFFFTF